LSGRLRKCPKKAESQNQDALLNRRNPSGKRLQRRGKLLQAVHSWISGLLLMIGLPALAVYMWYGVFFGAPGMKYDRPSSALITVIYTGFVIYFFTTVKWSW
jgi:hypothetical protein